MNRFERSWTLFKSSLNVIIRNKELLIFPIVTTIATVVIFLFFFAPAALYPTGHSYVSAEHWQALAGKYFRATGSGHHEHFTLTPIAGAYCAFLYLVSMFVATFFNVAFYNEILAALNGEAVSLSRGLRFACSRWKAILLWALFAGLIGLIIKAIEERLDIIGKIIVRLIGVAWSIASVFVIPVIVRDTETNNPLVMLKKSAGTVTQMWGEGLIGYIGIGAVNSIVVIFSAVLIGIAVAVCTAIQNFWLLGFVIAGWFISMVIWSYLMNVAGLVYKGALYLYAAEGIVTEPYDQQMLDSAWRFKKAKTI
ncbi:MAG TPA: DUF6159 family protein [Verrucomicrobiae bacterium]|nr:DUF6159 family protein [Verrucomicrobiae bacterium]